MNKIGLKCYEHQKDGISIFHQDSSSKFTQTAIGMSYMCFYYPSDHKLTCNGDNSYNQKSLTPQLVTHKPQVLSLQSGPQNTCATTQLITTKTQSIECWGRTYPDFSLNIVPAEFHFTIDRNLFPFDLFEVSVSWNTACALLKLDHSTDPVFRCWGRCAQGMCGGSAWEEEDEEGIIGHGDSDDGDDGDQRNAKHQGLDNFDQFINGRLTDQISQMIFNDLVNSEIENTNNNGNNLLTSTEFKNICFVSVGLNHMCQISETGYRYGSAVCLGDNVHGQASVPAEFATHTVQVAAGNSVTCAIKANQQLACWGSYVPIQQFSDINIDLQNNDVDQSKFSTKNKFNQAENYLSDQDDQSNFNYLNYNKKNKNPQIQNMPDTNIPHSIKTYTRQASTGGRHMCAHRGVVICQGNNDFGQLDLSSNTVQNTSIIEAGWDVTCASTLNNHIQCYGLNQQGQTDIPNYLKLQHLPSYFKELHQIDVFRKQIIQNQEFESISAGLTTVCAIAKDKMQNFKKLTCWGMDTTDVLGIPEEKTKNLQLKFVAVADEHICITETHQSNDQVRNMVRVETVGSLTVFDNLPANTNQNDTNPASTTNNQPHMIPTLSCQGSNALSQLDIPQPLLFSNNLMLAAGGAHSCASHANHSLICWGSDSQGQSSAPPLVAQEWVQALSVGVAHSCAVVWHAASNGFLERGESESADSLLLCWGSKWVASLHWNKAVLRPRLVASGWDQDCVVDAEGELWCQGDNHEGQCDGVRADELEAGVEDVVLIE